MRPASAERVRPSPVSPTPRSASAIKRHRNEFVERFLGATHVWHSVPRLHGRASAWRPSQLAGAGLSKTLHESGSTDGPIAPWACSLGAGVETRSLGAHENGASSTPTSPARRHPVAPSHVFDSETTTKWRASCSVRWVVRELGGDESALLGPAGMLSGNESRRTGLGGSLRLGFSSSVTAWNGASTEVAPTTSKESAHGCIDEDGTVSRLRTRPRSRTFDERGFELARGRFDERGLSSLAGSRSDSLAAFAQTRSPGARWAEGVGLARWALAWRRGETGVVVWAGPSCGR